MKHTAVQNVADQAHNAIVPIIRLEHFFSLLLLLNSSAPNRANVAIDHQSGLATDRVRLTTTTTIPYRPQAITQLVNLCIEAHLVVVRADYKCTSSHVVLV